MSTRPPRSTGPDRTARDDDPPPGSLAERLARHWRLANRLAALSPDEVAVGATPSDLLLRHDRVTLWRYRQAAALRPVAPVLIVHGFIGRASVTDLAPGRSLVADLAAAGVDVFTIHWGHPSRADRFMRIEDYLDDHLDTCIRAVTRLTGRPPVLLGVCEGGLFSLAYAALEPDRVAGLALTVTPADPHAAPDSVVLRWIRAFPPEDIARLIDSLGGLPGVAMGAAFQAMTPGRTMRKYTTGLAESAGRHEELVAFARMETWLLDRPDHPAEAAKQLVIGHYHENRLLRGGLASAGRTVDIGRLRLPILTAYGLRDHLVPPEQAKAILAMAPQAEHTDCALDAGHIGIFVSRRARGLLGARLVAWLDALVP